MKKILLMTALIAATLAPVASQAQDGRRGEDRREWRQDNRNDQREWRQSNRDDRREWRQNNRNDRREDWQRRRDNNRNEYRRGNWNAPFRYQSFNIGVTVPRNYWGSRYYVSNWSNYSLPRPARNYYRYVRHYDDMLLINTRNGRVIRVYRNFYW